MRAWWGLLGWVLLAGCGGDAPPPVAPPWDDDGPRLGHCEFTPAPSRAPGPAPTRSPLRAGYGQAYLELPIGTPLGGYGDRVSALGSSQPVDERARRWAVGMVPSVGLHDVPQVQALALEAGGAPLVIVRADVPYLAEQVLFDLERAVASDGSMRGRILLAASHSHAAWGAWIPTIHLAAGADKPREDLYARVVEASRSAIAEALAALEPARIGVAVDDDFDPLGNVTKDRRGENDAVIGPDGNDAGRGKDPVVWALRVDDEAGAPMVALVDLAVHGTLGEGANPLVSTDVPGAIARSLSSQLGYPVMHLQGAAGDVTPAEPHARPACPDATRCLDMPGLEILGARATALVRPLVESIATSREAAFEMVTRSFPIGRGGVVRRPDGAELYYLPPNPEYEPDQLLFDAGGRARSPFDEFNTAGGAGLCGSDAGTFAPLPSTLAAPPYGSCIDLDRGAGLVLSVFGIPAPELPICDSVRATAAALRMELDDGGWLLVGVPGEPTAPFTAYLRGRSPAGSERTLVVGYADEYAGYMLTAEDWLSGGYECSTNIWGPREGEQILEELVRIADLAWTPAVEDPEAGADRFEQFPFPPFDPVEPLVTGDHGTPSGGAMWWPDTAEPAVAQNSVPRAVGAARFVWLGGDPAIDFPVVAVEHETSPGVFAPVAGSGSREGQVVVSYVPDPLDDPAPARHRYGATWQPVPSAPWSAAMPTMPFSLPLGSYRFAVTGRARAAQGEAAYTVTSPAFEVTAASLAPGSSATRTGSSLSIVALLGPAPGLRALCDCPSDGEVPLPGPWTIKVRLADDSTIETSGEPNDQGAASIDLGNASPAAVEVEIRDAHGNGGTLPIAK